MAAAQGEAAFKTVKKVNDFDARSADERRSDTLESLQSSMGTNHCEEDTDEEEKENEVLKSGAKPGSGGLTDLEKAYRDILNAPLSPKTFGGKMSVVRAFKH